jgi:hypothetical protein
MSDMLQQQQFLRQHLITALNQRHCAKRLQICDSHLLLQRPQKAS